MNFETEPMNGVGWANHFDLPQCDGQHSQFGCERERMIHAVERVYEEARQHAKKKIDELQYAIAVIESESLRIQVKNQPMPQMASQKLTMDVAIGDVVIESCKYGGRLVYEESLKNIKHEILKACERVLKGENIGVPFKLPMKPSGGGFINEGLDLKDRSRQTEKGEG